MIQNDRPSIRAHNINHYSYKASFKKDVFFMCCVQLEIRNKTIRIITEIKSQ